MILYKNIVSTKKPSTAKEVIDYFRGDERIKGKKLKSFKVELNNIGTQMDDYTNSHSVNAYHYDITADFE